MGVQLDRQRGQNAKENLIGSLLAFNTSQTWTTSSGTGSASLDTNIFYQGVSSLKLLNTAPTTDLVVTNSVQSTTIPFDGLYGLTMYLRKDEADEFMTLEVETFQNAVSFDTQTFVLGSETTEVDALVNDKWIPFMINTQYNFSKSDDITFKFTLKGKSGTALLNTAIWIDGIQLYAIDTQDTMPPQYSKPYLLDLKFRTVTKTSSYTAIVGDVVLADSTSGNITIALPPAASSLDKIIIVKKIVAANSVIIDGDGSETIDGTTTKTLSGQYDSLTLISNGSNYYII